MGLTASVAAGPSGAFAPELSAGDMLGGVAIVHEYQDLLGIQPISRHLRLTC